MAKAAFYSTARGLGLLTCCGSVVRERLAARAEIARTRITAKAVLLHVLCLAFSEGLSVGCVLRKSICTFDGRDHALEDIAADRIRATDKVVVAGKKILND